MFFYPWYPALMLAVELHNVIDIRLRKIASGSVNAVAETRLIQRKDRCSDPGEVDDVWRKQSDSCDRLLPPASCSQRKTASVILVS